MPNYSTATTRALYDGAKVTLADSTLVTPFTTQAHVVGSDPSGNPPTITIQNKSALVATVQVSTDDVDADYVTYNTVAAGALIVLPIPDGLFFRLSLPSAPAAAIVVAR
jgi:hypothetical protein